MDESKQNRNIEIVASFCYHGLPSDLELKDMCINSMLEFIRNTPSVANFPPETIKKISKTAALMLRDSDRLDAFVLRMHEHIFEGIERVRLNQDNLSESNRDTLESHLLRCAGDHSSTMLRKTEDIKWGEKGEKEYSDSIIISARIHPKYCAYTYRDVGDIRVAMYGITKELQLAEKAFEAYLKSAEMLKKIKFYLSTYSTYLAGSTAFVIGKDVLKDLKNPDRLTQSEEWKNKGYPLFEEVESDYHRTPENYRGSYLKRRISFVKEVLSQRKTKIR